MERSIYEEGDLMNKKMWWQNAVVYQVYPKSFQDSDGDGIGDLRGIINRLDYIEKLGVDVIWLNPVYKTSNIDGGYDISDYKSINPTFGDMHDFKELLGKAHERGLKIMMDLVVNHSSFEHEWFQRASAAQVRIISIEIIIFGVTQLMIMNQTTGAPSFLALHGHLTRVLDSTICIYLPKNSPI